MFISNVRTSVFAEKYSLSISRAAPALDDVKVTPK